MYILFNLNLNDLFSFFIIIFTERENLMKARGEKKKIKIITYKTVIIMDIG